MYIHLPTSMLVERAPAVANPCSGKPKQPVWSSEAHFVEILCR